jgi:hypothetical protein
MMYASDSVFRVLQMTLATLISSIATPLWAANGTTNGVGNAFPIATQCAAIGAASDGQNYLVGMENHQTATTTIGAQLISSQGALIGSYIATGRDGIASSVAFDGTHYLLIWEDNGMNTYQEAFKVYGQFIDKDGVKVGTPFAISDQNIWFDGIKTMAFGAGNYLVTYTRLVDVSNGSETGNRFIAGRIVSPGGDVGSEFRISNGTGYGSDVAFDGTNFFVIWCVDTGSEIRGRFVSPAGVVGTEISVNASSAPSDNPKSVTFNGSNYLVVWNDEIEGRDTGTWDIFGQLVSPSGAWVGSAFPITSESGPQLVTTVVSDGTNYFATWMDMSNETNWDAFGQFISKNGTLLGDKLILSTNAGNQMPGAGYVGGKYLVVLNNGINLGENGISQVDSVTGKLVSTLPDPKILDGSSGIWTNRFGFTLTGVRGQTAVVESCLDLSAPDWKAIFTNTFASNSAFFYDPKWNDYSNRFYRIKNQ